MGSQQFCLKWNNHQSNLLNVFDQLLQNEAFVDVTLACEGLSLKAHKMVLSACSPYFQTLFLENPCKHPIVILNSVRYSELKAIVDFMYKGEVNVSQEQLSLLLKTAEMLKVKGLAEVTNQTTQSLGMNAASDAILSVPPASPPPSQLASHSQRRNGSPPPKRKKTRANPGSSAANSPQQPSAATNFSISKNASTEQPLNLDQTNDTHMPLESKICKEERSDGPSDSCMMDMPPKLVMEPASDLVDDQSSMSNITSEMPSYDQTKGDTPDLSSPPDITSSNIQSIPSTSGMQGANQDKESDERVSIIPITEPETARSSFMDIGLTEYTSDVVIKKEIIESSNSEGEMTLEFLSTAKGKRKLYLEGFLYLKEKEVDKKSYWRCENYRKLNCKARVTTVGDSSVVKKIDVHNHTADAARVEANKFISIIRADAKFSQDPPQSIISNATARINQAAATALPSMDSIRRTIRNIRNKQDAGRKDPPC